MMQMKEQQQMRTYQFRPQGVCSREMYVELDEGNIIRKLDVIGGCNGNLQGIASLVCGMRVEDVITRLEGIRCGAKPTSCPDKLARGLKQALEES